MLFIKFKPCVKPVKPVFLFITFFIYIFIIFVNKTVHFPNLEKPRLVILLNYLTRFQINSDEHFIGAFTKRNIINLVIFRTYFVCNICRIFETVNAHLVKAFRCKELFGIVQKIRMPAVINSVFLDF